MLIELNDCIQNLRLLCTLKNINCLRKVDRRTASLGSFIRLHHLDHSWDRLEINFLTTHCLEPLFLDHCFYHLCLLIHELSEELEEELIMSLNILV